MICFVEIRKLEKFSLQTVALLETLSSVVEYFIASRHSHLAQRNIK